MRPALLMIGWYSTGPTADPAVAHHLAASLEPFHNFALVHDDITDRSETHRGRPTLHREFAARRSASGEASDRFGESAAILVGDLALIWSDELFHAGRPGAEQLDRVLPLIDAMRNELVYGQYLDIENSGRGEADLSTPPAGCGAGGCRPRRPRWPLGLRPPDRRGVPAVGRLARRLRQPVTVPASPGWTIFGTGRPRPSSPCASTGADPTQADRVRRLLGCLALTEDQTAPAREIIIGIGAGRFVEETIAHCYRGALDTFDEGPLPGPHRAVAAAARRGRGRADELTMRSATGEAGRADAGSGRLPDL